MLCIQSDELVPTDLPDQVLPRRLAPNAEGFPSSDVEIRAWNGPRWAEHDVWCIWRGVRFSGLSIGRLVCCSARTHWSMWVVTSRCLVYLCTGLGQLHQLEETRLLRVRILSSWVQSRSWSLIAQDETRNTVRQNPAHLIPFYERKAQDLNPKRCIRFR